MTANPASIDTNETITEVDPAFPFVLPEDDGHADYFHGLSRRDWFAGQALTGLMGDNGIRILGDLTVAERAFRIADQMIDQSKKEK